MCPCPWSLAILLHVRALGLLLSWAISFRTLRWRDVVDDERTFLVWYVWRAATYPLPLTVNHQLGLVINGSILFFFVQPQEQPRRLRKVLNSIRVKFASTLAISVVYCVKISDPPLNRSSETTFTVIVESHVFVIPSLHVYSNVRLTIS
jgi:hypothetical protein